MTDEEPLMNIRPKTDFERLLWANNTIKELQAELKKCATKNGNLLSDISELKDFINKNKELKNGKRLCEAELRVSELKKEVKRLEKINQHLTTDNIYLKSRQK